MERTMRSRSTLRKETRILTRCQRKSLNKAKLPMRRWRRRANIQRNGSKPTIMSNSSSRTTLADQSCEDSQDTPYSNLIVVIKSTSKKRRVPIQRQEKTERRSTRTCKMANKKLPTGVKHIDPNNYSSGTDEDEMDESPVVGQGFPTSLRTLEKDTLLMKRQFPSVDTHVIEQVLVDTIPKEEDQHSYNAILTEAAVRLEAIHEELIAARRSTLRHVDP
ncbi:hypothetical protein Ae201684_016170 [Aphanomyces euteiches]|uniref:Uncharacterized protein n=1 Tax=Aphanomyces euteiches TaxID=100861 RepID=A0A6G0WD58_9STRA|nr:hypothetical protein Ae201684_016170 [Aphanomyces euteiches]